jgi:predicted transcriptional regulator
MLTYFHVLELIADRQGADLKAAFTAAGLPTSTFYRAKNGTDLHFDTANRVWQQLTGEATIPEGLHPSRNPSASVDVDDAA